MVLELLVLAMMACGAGGLLTSVTGWILWEQRRARRVGRRLGQTTGLTVRRLQVADVPSPLSATVVQRGRAMRVSAGQRGLQTLWSVHLRLRPVHRGHEFRLIRDNLVGCIPGLFHLNRWHAPDQVWLRDYAVLLPRGGSASRPWSITTQAVLERVVEEGRLISLEVCGRDVRLDLARDGLRVEDCLAVVDHGWRVLHALEGREVPPVRWRGSPAAHRGWASRSHSALPVAAGLVAPWRRR